MDKKFLEVSVEDQTPWFSHQQGNLTTKLTTHLNLYICVILIYRELALQIHEEVKKYEYRGITRYVHKQSREIIKIYTRISWE